MSQITEALLTIAGLIVGVTILSVILSKQSNTVAVLGASSAGFSNALSAATAPVTGKATAPSNTYGGSSFNPGSFSLPSFG